MFLTLINSARLINSNGYVGHVFNSYGSSVSLPDISSVTNLVVIESTSQSCAQVTIKLSYFKINNKYRYCDYCFRINSQFVDSSKQIFIYLFQ